MAEDFPDFHHKLCKKIAYLTTGFYHLNMKSDETDSIVQTIIDTYEHEMDNVVQKANEILEKNIKDNPQQREVHEIHTAYQEFKYKVEQERSTSIEEYTNYIKSFEEYKKQIQEETQFQIEAYQRETEDLKSKLQYMKKLVEKALGHEVDLEDPEKKAMEMDTRRLKNELEARNGEIGEWRMKYLELEKMYRDMEEAHLTSGKRTSENWSRGLFDHEGESYNTGLKGEEWEVDGLRRKLMEQEKLILALRNALGQENGVDGDDIASIEFGGTSNAEVSGMSAQAREFHKDMMLHKVQSQKQVMQENKEEVDKGAEKLQRKIEEYENRMKEANREHRKMIEILHSEYNENITEMESMFEKERIRYETRLQGMQATLDSRDEYINGLEDKIKSLELLKEKLDSDLKQLQDREHLLNEEIKRLTTVSEDSRRLFDERIETEKVKIEEAKALILQEAEKEKHSSLQNLREELALERMNAEALKEKRIKELEAQLETVKDGPSPAKLAEDYQNKVNELSQRHNNYVRELLEKHEERVESIEKKYEKQVNELKKELEKEKENVVKLKDEDKHNEIQTLKKEYEAKLHKISKSYDQQLQEKLVEYETKLKVKDESFANLKKEMDTVKDQLKNENKRFKDREASYKELERVVTEQNTSLGALKEELQGSPKSDGAGKSSQTKRSTADKDKGEILKEHVKYAQEVGEMLRKLKNQYEEKITLLMERYNELLKAFENRPSRVEDLAMIKQLTEEGSEREEVLRKVNDNSRGYLEKKENTNKIFASQPNLNGNSVSVDKPRRPVKNMSPSNATTILPPISISQFTIQVRSPPQGGLLSSKKFFK